MSLIIVIAMLFSWPVVACESTGDCYSTARCQKPYPSSALGHCVGGHYPGRLFDDKPAFNVDHPKEGYTCLINDDCVFRGKLTVSCTRTKGAGLGVCL